MVIENIKSVLVREAKKCWNFCDLVSAYGFYGRAEFYFTTNIDRWLIVYEFLEGSIIPLFKFFIFQNSHGLGISQTYRRILQFFLGKYPVRTYLIFLFTENDEGFSNHVHNIFRLLAGDIHTFRLR